MGCPVELRIHVELDPDADAADLDEAAGQLRRELLTLDVLDVQRPTSDLPPPGARAVETALLGTLLVTVGSELLRGAVQAAVDWLTHRRHTGCIKLEIAGDSVEVTDPSADEQRQLIEAFLARNTPGPS